jgi:DNA-binding GntR family transcriptional regulator
MPKGPGRGKLLGGGEHRSPYEQIKEAILDGTLEPGNPLVESQIAEWCGVSRTPVREALTRLEQDGLVQRGDRGLVVRDRSPEEILDIYETRIVLEVTAARTAAERHTSFDRVRLEKLLRAAEKASPDNPGEMARRNREFHQGIWKASHNESLVDLLTRLNLHLGRYPATTLAYPGRWEKGLKEHQCLVDAILSGDADRAVEVAREHFVEARDIRLTLWEEDTY